MSNNDTPGKIPSRVSNKYIRQMTYTHAHLARTGLRRVHPIFVYSNTRCKQPSYYRLQGFSGWTRDQNKFHNTLIIYIQRSEYKCYSQVSVGLTPVYSRHIVIARWTGRGGQCLHVNSPPPPSLLVVAGRHDRYPDPTLLLIGQCRGFPNPMGCRQNLNFLSGRRADVWGWAAYSSLQPVYIWLCAGRDGDRMLA